MKIRQLESAMETEQLSLTQGGVYEVEIGSDDDCLQESFSVQSNVYGFKIVDNNLDKNFRPIFKERNSKQYFHAYGLNFSERLHVVPTYLLPSVSDLDTFYQV